MQKKETGKDFVLAGLEHEKEPLLDCPSQVLVIFGGRGTERVTASLDRHASDLVAIYIYIYRYICIY